MNRSVALISGIGLGAGLMYYLDLDLGRRRRALSTAGAVKQARLL